MISWTLKNADGISRERIEELKQLFLNRIGPFRQEFEEGNGWVEIDFSVDPEDKEAKGFSYSYDGDIGNFNHRVNLYNGNA